MGKLIKESDDKGRFTLIRRLLGNPGEQGIFEDHRIRRVFQDASGYPCVENRWPKYHGPGSKAIFPIVDELIRVKEDYKLLAHDGGGTRARHVYNIGVDLGMPTGVLSKLGDKVSSQNAVMLSVLLAKPRRRSHRPRGPP